jgi:ElaB/YqjD/DUF883 family membrane-anchored ribosome-binding protein
MKALREREFQQMPVPHAVVFNFVNPELAAFAGVTRDGLAVLAGDGDFHIGPPDGCCSGCISASARYAAVSIRKRRSRVCSFPHTRPTRDLALPRCAAPDAAWCLVRQRTETNQNKADCEVGLQAGCSAQPSMENHMKHAMDVFANDQWLTDIDAVLADAEALLSETANQGGEKMAQLRAKVESSLRVARRRMAEAQAAVLDKTRESARATNVYVHKNPWNAIGAAAGVGLLLGFLLGRR